MRCRALSGKQNVSVLVLFYYVWEKAIIMLCIDPIDLSYTLKHHQIEVTLLCYACVYGWVMMGNTWSFLTLNFNWFSLRVHFLHRLQSNFRNCLDGKLSISRSTSFNARSTFRNAKNDAIVLFNTSLVCPLRLSCSSIFNVNENHLRMCKVIFFLLFVLKRRVQFLLICCALNIEQEQQRSKYELKCVYKYMCTSF